MLDGVGVAVYDQLRAQLARPADVDVLEVQAFQRGVYLQRGAGIGGGAEQRVEVGVYGLAATDEARGQVALWR